MGSWSESVFHKMNEIATNLAQTMGLQPGGMPGDDFERAIGDFLSWRESYGLTKTFEQVGYPNPGSGRMPQIEQWIQISEERQTAIIRKLNESLWAECGAARLDITKAVDAYMYLSTELQIREIGHSLCCATTNYDRSLEESIHRLGWNADDGFRAASPHLTAYLQAGDIVPWGSTDEVPVLHLHGAVGWYQDSSHRVRRVPWNEPYDTRETPALLYPDPKKNPYQAEEVSALWERFRFAIRNSTHAIVLGHSLNDMHLLDALEDEGANLHLLITRLAGDQEESDRIATLLDNRDLKSKVKSLGGAVLYLPRRHRGARPMVALRFRVTTATCWSIGPGGLLASLSDDPGGVRSSLAATDLPHVSDVVSESHSAPWPVSKVSSHLSLRAATEGCQAGVGAAQVGRMPALAEPGALGHGDEPTTERRAVDWRADGRADDQVVIPPRRARQEPPSGLRSLVAAQSLQQLGIELQPALGVGLRVAEGDGAILTREVQSQGDRPGGPVNGGRS
jgi:hypothetical protein